MPVTAARPRRIFTAFPRRRVHSIRRPPNGRVPRGRRIILPPRAKGGGSFQLSVPRFDTHKAGSVSSTCYVYWPIGSGWNLIVQAAKI